MSFFTTPHTETLTTRLERAASSLPPAAQLLLDKSAMSALESLSGHQPDLCLRVCSVCKPYLQLRPDETEEIWLKQLYQCLCNRMFPDEQAGCPWRELTDAERLYLLVLEALFSQRIDSFDPLSDLLQFDPQQLDNSRVQKEYSCFRQAVAQSHLMALMRIGRQIQPFDPASHTIGVHNVAMHTAILANEAGLTVDLPLVSAAALGHDIGKFGCRGDDATRIPYLHYYYTWQWFRDNDMDEIGYISANHSTWDLEFENLPVESLLLIYADFRVRGSREPGGREQVIIYSLADAYEMIFSKLYNMTPEKQARYRTVYTKLRDFERLLASYGVPTELEQTELVPVVHRDTSLMPAEESLQALRSMTLQGSIDLMRTISIDKSLERLLEQAKGEKNLQYIRTYLLLLEEYSTYMSKANKQKTLVLLYELLMHPDGDVRYTSGRIMGQILANSGPKYRKERPQSAKADLMTPTMMALLSESVELWEQYIHLCLHPDRKISPKHALRISNSLKTICTHLFATCDEKDAPKLIEPLLQQVLCAEGDDRFILVDALCHVPCEYLPADRLEPLVDKLSQMLGGEDIRLDIIVLRYLKQLKELPEMQQAVEQVAQSYTPPESEYKTVLPYLKNQLLSLPADPLTQQQASQIHLSNLKNAVHWTVKLEQIQILCNYAQENPQNAFHTALHLSNLLSVSEHLPVRKAAGENLIRITPLLSVDQINEITIDLVRELETGQEQIALFIPPYVGQLMCLLPDKELRETVNNLEALAQGAAIRPAQVALYTLGEVLNAVSETETAIIEQVLGIIMTGISHYEPSVHQTAMCVLCRDVFGSDRIPMERRHDIFVHMHKKLLTILSEPHEGQLTFFNRAAMLNHLYRYIVQQEVFYGPFRFPAPKPAAFFPGTFDPFSVGHKQIVQEIRSRGFEVYLAVDEFSWSKKTLPKLLRRQIVCISVAAQPDTYLFPDNIPINIAIPEDLAMLKQLLPDRELYLVAGSDVILNASAYQNPQPGGAAEYNHIVFCRDNAESSKERLSAIIRGKLQLLSLPPFYESVSSTRIRESIDRKLDISMLVDPMVQTFIYENSLYVRSPEMKNVLQQQKLFFRLYQSQTPELPRTLNEKLADEAAQAVVLYTRPERLTGWTLGRSIVLDDLYDVLGSIEAASYVRAHASGQILLVDEVWAEGSDRQEFYRMLLNELLVRSLEGGHTYALCRCAGGDGQLRQALGQLGFLPAGRSEDIYYVDMRSPVMLLQDVMLHIKTPHRDAPAVIDAVTQTRLDLRKALNNMFPGKLLLCFDSEMLKQSLLERILKINGVEDMDGDARALGPYMCVPYGEIFSDEIVPHTVTKTLHVEKCYEPDLLSFEIIEYPDYSPLQNQVRTLKSFQRPIILVDDFLNRGHRIEKLDKLFRKEELSAEHIMVAIMSGYGRDLMRVQNRRADCEYFIPNLHYWVTESLLYPFIGGDCVSDRKVREHMQPSVNMILPYGYPYYLTDATETSVQELSRIALENALKIMQVLEREHQIIFSTALSIRRLGEALQQPRIPDRGNSIVFDLSLPASNYLEEDLAQLECICRRGGFHK